MSSGEQIVATAPVPRRSYRAYGRLAGRPLNFDPIGFDVADADPDWHVDRLRRVLPAEPPGAPVAGGSFAAARDVLVRYEFADPRLVRAVYDAAAPLDGRDMLLVGRFFGLRFDMGVRVGGVRDGPVDLDGRPAHRFAWHYRTLEGHLEQGHMDYDVVKWHDTGAVEFRIRAYSRRAPIDNPVVRLGFGLFGRRMQLRFYVRTLQRMRALVAGRVPG